LGSIAEGRVIIEPKILSRPVNPPIQKSKYLHKVLDFYPLNPGDFLQISGIFCVFGAVFPEITPERIKSRTSVI